MSKRSDDPRGASIGRPLVAVAFLLAVSLAGCVGGEGQSPAAETPEPDVQNASAVPDASEDSGLRPHVHNRWFDDNGDPISEISLVDRTLDVQAASRDRPRILNECRHRPSQGGPIVCLGKTTFFPEPFPDGTSKIVPPGTARVEVTLDFEPSDFETLRLYYQHRMSGGQWKELGVFEPGETQTISPVTVQMSDDGHAQVSAWKFHVEARGNPHGASQHAWIGDGPVQAEIVAHRTEGDLPLEPPHPEFWIETDTYRTSYLEGEVGSFVHAGTGHVEQGACPTGIGGVCTPVQAGSDGIFWVLRPGYVANRLSAGEMPPTLQGEHARALVPPGTSTIGAQITVEGGSDVPVEVCLRAMASPAQGPYGVPVSCRTHQGGETTFTVSKAITGRDVDSFYTDNTGRNASRWTFFVQLKAPEVAGGAHAPGSFEGQIQAATFVTDRERFEMPAWGMTPPGGGS